MRPGPRNAITDVDGIAVGNAEDRAVRTGVSVVVPSRPAVAAVDVRGGAPGTRETDLLRPENTVERVDAVVLSGGSAHGLEAAGGVTAALAMQGIGFEVLGHRVPIVPAAILFDLANGGDKAWGDEAPYRTLGRAALQAAGGAFEIGNAGAGYGATAGGLKGGLGTASLVDDEGCTVGALAAVNSFGSVLMPGGPHFWAWPFERDGEFGGLAPPAARPAFSNEEASVGSVPGAQANTTLVVVATDAALTQADALRLAVMAQDGLARAIRPVHTPYDGDLVFTLATGVWPLDEAASGLIRLGGMAGDCVARAIARAVFAAGSLGDIISYREHFGIADQASGGDEI
jgi:L-aminopeptidase/D-esterase-like protein